MARGKSPAFPFYAKDFYTDGHVAGMSLAECGAYIRLLCVCWWEGSLPADLSRLARIVGVSPRVFRLVWPAIRVCFTEKDGRLTQRRLDEERQKQAENREQRRLAGRASAATRGNIRSTGVQHPLNEKGNDTGNGRATTVQRKVNLPIPIPIPTSVSDLNQKDLARSLQRATQTDPRPAKTPLAGDARFDRFWAVYPLKKGKDEARKAWHKRQPSDALTELICQAVAAQQAWPEWTTEGGRFIPHPATWLNRGSWDDEPARPVEAAVSDTTRANLAAREALLARLEEES